MIETLADDLAHRQSLGAFHDLLVAHGIHQAGPRFAHLELDITNRCNLRCVMCYHSFESDASRPHGAHDAGGVRRRSRRGCCRMPTS